MRGNERPSFYRARADRPENFLTRNKKEKQHMFEWTCSRLHDWAEADEWSGTHLDKIMDEWSAEGIDSVRRWTDVDAAIRFADKGDVEALRHLFQKIARFIHPEPLEVGKHRPKPARRWPYPPKTERDRIDLAAAETFIVRAIWKNKKPYGYGRSNQPSNKKAVELGLELWRPEEIVALRWDVTEEQVLERLKRPL